MKRIKSICLFLLIALMASPASAAVNVQEIDAVLSDTAAHLLAQVPDPQVSAIGGEWTVLGLARSGYPVPASYFAGYYESVCAYIADCDGVLHEKKYTEYARVVLALTALGYDPTNVSGYNLLAPLSDFDQTIWQGLNGPIFALLAFDSGGYEIPQVTGITQASRDLYLAEILSRQLPEGGFPLSGTDPDADITAMALGALAKYQDRPQVKAATDKALSWLSTVQGGNGGFDSWGSSNLESSVQVITALCELGISVDDPRFVKNGNTLFDHLLSHRTAVGGFRHNISDSESSLMATEQALYGLAALSRLAHEEKSLYRMDDVTPAEGPQGESGAGLPGKHEDIGTLSLPSPGKTFQDIFGLPEQSAIEALAARGVLNGVSETVFAPYGTMTRAQFAAMVVRSLALPAKETGQFTDVPPLAWYASPAETANYYGLVKGTSETAFGPNIEITKEQAATILARTAALCGLRTDMTEDQIRNTLAQFGDYTSISDWARASMAFCYRHSILSNQEFNCMPQSIVTRVEVAQMLFLLLEEANLI